MNRKENICEYSLLGLFPKLEAGDISFHLIEDLCGEVCTPFVYEITTYRLDATESFRTISNLVELHHNLSDT
jgi:hypothetical protein